MSLEQSKQKSSPLSSVNTQDSSIHNDNTTDKTQGVEIQEHLLSSSKNCDDINLKLLLDRAYNLIKTKENELDLATQVRHQYMEENLTLQTQCEELKKALDSNDTDDKTEIITPVSRSRYDNQERKTANLLKLKTQERKGIISEDELDDLHQQNNDLQSKLATLTQEKEYLEKINLKQARELEQELNELRKELDQSNKKIEDLEDKNFELAHRQKSIHQATKPSKLAEETSANDQATSSLAMAPFSLKSVPPNFDTFYESNDGASQPSNQELVDRIQKLESQSRKVETEKKELEVHISSLLEELNRLNRHCYELEEANSRITFYENLFGKNNTKIVDLTDGSEMNRSVSGNGLFFNLLNSARSSVSSFAMEAPYLASPAATLRHRNPMNHHRSASASSAGQAASIRGRTLWKEIEGESPSNKNSISGAGDTNNDALYNWIHSSSQTRLSLSGGPEPLNAYSPTQYNFPPSNQTPTVNAEDSVSVVGINPSSSTSLHKKMTMRRPRRPRGVVNIIQNFFLYIWTWFKFITLLTTAVGVALYQGPEHQYRDYY